MPSWTRAAADRAGWVGADRQAEPTGAARELPIRRLTGAVPIGPAVARIRRLTAALWALAVLTGCTSAAPPAPAAPPGGAAAIQAAVAVVNAAAGSPAEQRAALATVTDPAGRPALDRCPPATRTVRLEPVYPSMTPDPRFTDADGHSPPGQVVAVPTLVRVYADGALATTEVSVLHIGVVDGTARFAPLCLG